MGLLPLPLLVITPGAYSVGYLLTILLWYMVAGSIRFTRTCQYIPLQSTIQGAGRVLVINGNLCSRSVIVAGSEQRLIIRTGRQGCSVSK